MAPAYREYQAPTHLAALVACVWENDALESCVQLVVPDGCVDLIWLGPQDLVVAGADTGPRAVMLPAGARLSGIRLRPGAAGNVLGVPAVELRDHDVRLAALWGALGEELERSFSGGGPARRRRLLADAVARRHAEPDPLVLAAARKLTMS